MLLLLTRACSSIPPHGLQHPDRRFYSSTANTNVTHEPTSVSSPNKGKGKGKAPAPAAPPPSAPAKKKKKDKKRKREATPDETPAPAPPTKKRVVETVVDPSSTKPSTTTAKPGASAPHKPKKKSKPDDLVRVYETLIQV